MNTKNLYEKEDYDIYSIYYTDKECTKPYTGHAEDYWNGRLCWESDIVNGYCKGIRKDYDNIHDVLEAVMEVKYNKANGLGFEYHKNGKITSIALYIDDIAIDYFCYDEAGRMTEKFILQEPYDIFGIDMSKIKDKIPKAQEKYNLQRLNDEILKYGRPMKYGMPYPIQLLDDKKGV